MSEERALEERIRAVLRPYASNWSGSLGRGDLVIPNAELGRVVTAIIEALREGSDARSPASELEVFEALAEIRRLPSIQDQAEALRRRFHVSARGR